MHSKINRKQRIWVEKHIVFTILQDIFTFNCLKPDFTNGASFHVFKPENMQVDNWEGILEPLTCDLSSFHEWKVCIFTFGVKFQPVLD